MRLKCEEEHRISWTSSPRLPNRKLLVDYRLAHAALTTGLHAVQYQRFISVSGIDNIRYRTLDGIVDEISQVSKVLVDDSTQEALRCEMLDNTLDDINPRTDMTDARRGWRMNSKDTNVMCIGLKTHRVLKAIHVTRQEETCAQKHEIYGTRKIYEYFESCEDGCGVDLGVHSHDRNMSVNKIIREEQLTTLNQNDNDMQLKPSQKK